MVVRGTGEGGMLLAAGLAVLAAAALATWAGLQPPAPLPMDAPEEVFSAARAGEALRDLYGGLGPHPVGSEANRGLRRRIEERLRALGLEPGIQRELSCASPGAVCAIVENIVVRIEGSEAGRGAVLLSTHYDSVPAGPGVSDAGVSVAATLEIARILAAGHRGKSPVILFIGDGEEAGLLGARAFLRSHPWAAEVGAVINMEARGTAGRSWMFETSGGGAWLVEAYARSVPHPATASVAYAVYRRLPTDTDLTVYRAGGLQGVGFAFIGRVQHYHTPLDDLDHLSLPSLQHQGANALALLRALTDADLQSPPRGEAVFFDLFGILAVRWPAPISAWMAVVALLLSGTAAWRLGQSGDASAGRILAGFLAWVTTAILGILAGMAALYGLDLIGAFAEADRAHAWTVLGAAWAAGAAAALATAWLWSARAGSAGLAGGGALAWSLLSVGLTIFDPALSYLALVPAILAGATLLLVPPRTGFAGRALGLVVPLAGGAVVWLPLLFVLYGAMGRTVLAAITLLVALLFTLAAPPFAATDRTGRRILMGGACTALVAFAILAALLPARSAELPGRLSAALHHDADGGTARWVFTGSHAIPASLVEAAGGALRDEPGLPWWEGGDPVADAPRPEIDGPVFDVVGETIEQRESGSPGAGTTVVLRSRRGAPTLDLILPAGAALASVRYPDGLETAPGEGWDYGEGRWRVWRFLAVPPEGVEVRIAPGGEPLLRGWLLDRSAGIPGFGNALLEARPRDRVPSQSGDTTASYRAIEVTRGGGSAGADPP